MPKSLAAGKQLGGKIKDGRVEEQSWLQGQRACTHSPLLEGKQRLLQAALCHHEVRLLANELHSRTVRKPNKGRT